MPAQSVARTYIVPAWIHRDRDDWVDEGAYAAGNGLDESLPPYLGVWHDPERQLPYHLFSDYPPETFGRFGWTREQAQVDSLRMLPSEGG